MFLNDHQKIRIKSVEFDVWSILFAVPVQLSNFPSTKNYQVNSIFLRVASLQFSTFHLNFLELTQFIFHFIVSFKKMNHSCLSRVCFLFCFSPDTLT